jgi:hypothetical protein
MSIDRELRTRSNVDEWERERRAWNLPLPKHVSAAARVRRPLPDVQRGGDAGREPAPNTVDEAARS